MGNFYYYLAWEARMRLKLLLLLICSLGLINSSADQIAIDKITESLEKILLGTEVSHIRESKIPGVYEVLVGAEVLYISKDGQYMFRGELFDLANRLNLSEQQRTVARVGILSNIPDGDYIKFSANNQKHTVYVFTDITCSYCQKFQNDMAEYNKRGISIKYLAFPRDGAGTQASRNMESIWCAADRNQAFKNAMTGKGISEASCANPVNDQFELGLSLGVRATPTLYTEDGRLLQGYKTPDELLSLVVNNQ